MKIEKINKNQIKIILSSDDLAQRNLNIHELAYSYEKMQGLFSEVMEQAITENSFRPDGDTPLMLEAALLPPDSIMIIVTKVSNMSDAPEILNLIPRSREDRQFRKRGIIDTQAQTAKPTGLCVYSFASLNDAAGACARTCDALNESALYKYMGRYYLVASGDSSAGDGVVDTVFAEYGQKQLNSSITLSFLAEHGELIIADDAAAKLCVIG